jgi:hypothetical protein
VSQELNSSKNPALPKKQMLIFQIYGALFRVIRFVSHKKLCPEVKKLELHKEFLTLSYKKWFLISIDKIRIIV